jgi:hypothetical protein
MIWVIAGFGVLLLIWALAQAFVRANPANLATGLRWSAVGIGGAAVVALAATGRLGPALAIGAAVLPFALRVSRLWKYWRNAGGPAPGQTSDVETEWLRMSLDHDTGRMDGVVRRGPFQGRRLDELSREEALALWRQIRAEDEASASLLETWLERAFPNWREAESRGEGGPAHPARMSADEALHVLGLQPGAGEEEIRAAHRRLMMRVHPDQGGSDWLAARLNEARDVLLGDA